MFFNPGLFLFFKTASTVSNFSLQPFALSLLFRLTSDTSGSCTCILPAHLQYFRLTNNTSGSNQTLPSLPPILPAFLAALSSSLSHCSISSLRSLAYSMSPLDPEQEKKLCVDSKIHAVLHKKKSLMHSDAARSSDHWKLNKI